MGSKEAKGDVLPNNNINPKDIKNTTDKPQVNVNPNEVKNTAILIVGCTGAGKSTLGNWTLDEGLFESENKMDRVTIKCQTTPININGREFVMIDTPGIFDAKVKDEEHLAKIERLIDMCTYGIQAIILVINIEHYQNFEETVRMIKQFLGDGVIKHMIVAFSHVSRKQTEENQIEGRLNLSMKKFLETIENRWIISPNPDIFTRDDQVVKESMNSIKKMILKFNSAYNLLNFRDARPQNYRFSKIFLIFFIIVVSISLFSSGRLKYYI